MGHEKQKTWPKLRYGRGNIRGPSLLLRRPNADIERRFFFRRPNFGLRPSDVETIFAAPCLGRRKYVIGRRYPPWPKPLFLVVVPRVFG